MIQKATSLQLTPTWKPSFVLPYESDWSIREKFSFLNVVARSTIKIRKIEELRTSTAETIPFIHEMSNVKVSQFMNVHHVRVCPECIKYGYHSNLHQLLLYDTCFIHKDSKLITTNINLQQSNNFQNYYETNHITTIKNVVDNGHLLEEIINVDREFTHHKLIQYINLNYETDINNLICNNLKAFLRSQMSSQTSNVEGVRAVISVAKKDLPEMNENAIKELSKRYSIEYLNNTTLYERTHIGQCTSAYMKMLIDDFICAEFSSEEDYYHDVSIMDTWEGSGKYRQQSRIDRYAKVITIMHIINSRKPTFYRQLQTKWHIPTFECFHPINIPTIMSRLGSVFIEYSTCYGSVQKTDVMSISHAFLKDLFDDTSRQLESKITSGEFDISDDLMINRENFYIPASQYVLMDEGYKVTLYACMPDYKLK